MKLTKLPMYINGAFLTKEEWSYLDVLNPSTEEVIAQVPLGGAKEVQAAVDAATAAQGAWEKLPAIERAQYLKKIAQGIRDRSDELIATIIQEGGKTKDLATTEVFFTADYLEYVAEWARRYEGEIIQSDRPNEMIFLFKRAIGVTAGILPWNFPFFLIARKVAPALLTGNTSIIKPSELTPINAYLFAEIVQATHLPPGVLNVVYGLGHEIGNDLSQHEGIGMISLTGSLPAGQAVMRNAANNITKVSLELGGKAPAIVLQDADLDLAVEAIVASRVINSGQVCNCAERVFVHEEIYDAFLNKLVTKINQVKCGDPNQENDVDYGPLIEEKALNRVLDKISLAIDQGATLYHGGQRIDRAGYFIEPTILTNVKPEMEIMQQETFAPVIPITTFSNIDEVLAWANDCDYGLTSSVYTTDMNQAFKVINGLKFGETYVNRENFEAMQGFHAGWRKSGIGGADGKHGLEEYLATQVVYLQTK